MGSNGKGRAVNGAGTGGATDEALDPEVPGGGGPVPTLVLGDIADGGPDKGSGINCGGRGGGGGGGGRYDTAPRL